MKNYKLTLMYDGTNFCGWQKQKNGRSVCGELENAVSVVSRCNADIIGVSRTDAGVHAKHYTANVFLDTKTDTDKLFYGVNALLPDDISLISIEKCPDDFHARYDVKSKTYVYTVDNSAFGDVFLQKYAWRFRYFLDIDEMQKAASYFVGEHDFSAFMSQGGSAKTFVRTVYSCDVEKSGDTVKITVRGNGFLYNMVRIIAGTLVWVGTGKIKAADIPLIIESKDRKKAGVTAPPQGLILFDTEY